MIFVLSFVLLKYSNNKKRDIALIALMLIIIFLSFRRTALILSAVSLSIFMFMSNIKQMLKYVLPIAAILVIIYPIYEQPLNSVIKARGKRATLENKFESEARYLEIKVVTQRSFKFKDLQYSLIGKEYLNSFGTYATSEFMAPRTRILHTDYAVILHGSGIIGLSLYMTIILLILFKTIKCIRVIGIKNDISILLASLVIILILVTPSGSILNITFRTTYFILLGAVMRVADDMIKYKSKTPVKGRFYHPKQKAILNL